MTIITSTEALKEVIAPLHTHDIITVDTEFLREKTYYPTICLIQIGTADDAFAIDPLAEDIDLTPLFELLLNPDVCKVMHAASQDLEIFYLLMKELPKNLFDTQIAAQILGIGEAVGYGKLVEDICGVKLDKSSRHTDWTQRPLSDKQLDYALSDVTYLREIHRSVYIMLEELGRLPWFNEEMERFSDVSLYDNAPEDAWKKLNLTSGSAVFKSICVELATWREHYAREKNKPRTWILKNDAIYELASVQPASINDLHGLRFYKPSSKTLNELLLKHIEIGKHKPAPTIPKRKRMSAQTNTIVDVLKLLLKHQCEKHNIVPSVIAKSSELQLLAEQDSPDVPALSGWRYDIFGRYAQELKNGKLAITIDNGQVNIVVAGE